MNDLKIFFNTKIEGNGKLGSFADEALSPVRYFFRGRNVSIKEIKGQGCVHDIKSYKSEHSLKAKFHDIRFTSKTDPALKAKKVTLFRTVKMILLFVPGIFVGTIAKTFTYLSHETLEKHQLAKNHFTPIEKLTINLNEDDLNRQNQLNQKIHNLVLKGTGKKLPDQFSLDRLYPKKRLILDGVKFTNFGYTAAKDCATGEERCIYGKETLQRYLSDDKMANLFRKYPTKKGAILVAPPFSQKLGDKRFNLEVQTCENVEEAFLRPEKKEVIQIEEPKIKESLSKEDYRELIKIFGYDNIKAIKKFDPPKNQFFRNILPHPLNFVVRERLGKKEVIIFVRVLLAETDNRFRIVHGDSFDRAVVIRKVHSNWVLDNRKSNLKIEVNVKSETEKDLGYLLDRDEKPTETAEWLNTLFQGIGISDNQKDKWILGAEVNRCKIKRKLLQEKIQSLEENLEKLNGQFRPLDLSDIDLNGLIKKVGEKREGLRRDSPFPAYQKEILQLLKKLTMPRPEFSEDDPKLDARKYTNFFSDGVLADLNRVQRRVNGFLNLELREEIEKEDHLLREKKAEIDQLG